MTEPEYLSDEIEFTAVNAAMDALRFKPMTAAFVGQSPADKTLTVFVVVPDEPKYERLWTAHAVTALVAVRKIVPSSHSCSVRRYEGPKL